VASEDRAAVDRQTTVVAAAVKAVLHRRFGDRLAAIYLFGSRARGDHRLDSDLDIAVVLHDVGEPLASIDRELLDVTYPVEIESGVHIQAWALPTDAMEGVKPEYRARLLATVRNEGVRL
jgi:predicted nucleotidyltransferase